jgi:hypothetical protein
MAFANVAFIMNHSETTEFSSTSFFFHLPLSLAA